MNLLEEWRELRRVGTPWLAVRTSDYRATWRALAKDKEAGVTNAFLWTCTDGAACVKGKSDWSVSGEFPPNAVLSSAIGGMPEGSVLFMVLPDQSLFGNNMQPGNSYFIQAIANVRDEFKTTGRTLVLLGTSMSLPAFLNEDVPIFDDPLPDRDELAGIIARVCEAGKVKLDDKDVSRAAEACLGMARFPAEDAVCRKLRKGGINLDELSRVRQSMIEDNTDKALTFERERWTFEQIGGMSSFKNFMRAIFDGPKSPSLVVRVDEIDKSVTAASTGAVADNTGVSQDILKCLLTEVENNKWLGLMAVGGPGVGKTLSSICTGNTFGVRTLSLDLGAVKGSLVGETEQKIRRVMDVLKRIGGEKVLFMATANRLDTLPPELLRRFWLGTWYWDLPDAEERRAIWKIQLERFSLKPQPLPKDDEWTGSDIRNACQMAWVTGQTVMKASDYITIAGRTSREQIEKLRVTAEKSGYRCANRPGAYSRPKSESVRRLNVS